MRTEYSLQCLGDGLIFPDDGRCLSHEEDKHAPAFLRTVYAKKKLEIKPDSYGLYRFADWLPVHRVLEGSAAPLTYKSENLSKRLGLSNLYITFSGYWPEKGAKMLTGTFKECEAYSVCSRLPQNFGEILVVASAGNTARSFSYVCSENNIRLLVVVPESNLSSLWFEKHLNPCVTLVATGKGTDYFDAIQLAELFCQCPGFFPEGGARNIARRDGMATIVYSAVTTIGGIPDYYFQAVGSGTGAIAAWEANLRFIGGGYGDKKMKHILSQNAPFLPLYDSWKKRSRELICPDEVAAKEQIDKLYAVVLSNRNPPYSITGGLYDALQDTNGDMVAVSNGEAFASKASFEVEEGIDISPAASVAVASLEKAVKNRDIEKDAVVMLNITGGGMERYVREHSVSYLKPKMVIRKDEFNLETIENLSKKIDGSNYHGYIC